MNSTTKSSPSCWICLCDEPDDDGKLPVRDCSCRGDTGAGYAHLSCLIKYAQTKSMELANKNDKSDKFFEAWQRCPNCEQTYQHQLVIDLADSLLEFMDNKYGEFSNPIDYVRMVDALENKLDALKIGSLDKLGEDGVQIAKEMVKLVEDMKRKYVTNAIAPSASTQRVVSDNEARAYHNLSLLYVLDMSNDGAKRNSLEKAIYYAEKSRNIYKAIGNSGGVDALETTLSMMNRSNFSGFHDLEGQLNTMRQIVNERVAQKGAEDGEVIGAATNLAEALHFGNYIIEAERILTKYLPISRRVHGVSHAQTKEIESLLNRGKARFVALENGEEFQALRYEDECKKCVIQGPLERDSYDKRNEGTVYTVDSNSLLMTNGTPIICQGLKKAAHLNGKLADVRSFDKDKGRYTIHFEDNSLKPVAVKKENARIAFDLPDAE